jgi:membrane protein implicated in regulation of membrane protease activity
MLSQDKSVELNRCFMTLHISRKSILNFIVNQFEPILFSPQERQRADIQKQLRSQARVHNQITPLECGRVYYQGTYWFGRCEDNNPDMIQPGEIVQVLRREGNTLIVYRSQSRCVVG